MDYRFPAFALVASLLALAIVAASFGAKSAYAQSDDTWFVGEGAKQDMYVKYRIQELDTNEGRPYEMTIYFKEQQDGDWIAPTFVEDQGKVVSGTLKLGSNLAPLSGGADVPDEMNVYIGGYRGSLQWLEAFSPQEAPKSLNAPSWGKLACIGCEDLKPQGQAKVTVEAGTYDTIQLGWHRGQTDSKLWVVNGFPYPIKADTYADVTTGTPPTLFKFELLKTGMGQPEVPKTVEEIPEPPLTQKTGRGTYEVQLDWDPASIKPEEDVTFGLTFLDSTGFPLERVSYDFNVVDAKGNTVADLKDQFADDGTNQHQVKFGDAGAATITVTISAISGQQASNAGFVEAADFHLVVVPEFPVSAAIVAGVIVGLVVLLTRVKGTALGGIFGSKGAL